ncbi:MAG TPA: acyltransferase [Chloroflexaceae bacterium]|nr:acyltransferase [Chloroflexaceae bacterium]
MTSTLSPTVPHHHGRLAFLDGLRALAALAVVAVHAFQIYGYDLHSWIAVESPMPFGDGLADRALMLSYSALWKWGPFAVPVFIVLSGFSLMLPVARSGALRPGGGSLHFFQRRAWRILPPYYAALALAMLITALVPGFGTQRGVYWDLALPTFQADVLLAHLFVVHNLPWPSDPLFGMRINPPLWSIAVEMQIYLLFPLLLLLWRRAGALVATGAALLAGIVPASLGLLTWPLSNGHYLGLFALGALGADVVFRWSGPAVARRGPWLGLAIAGAAAFAALIALGRFTPPGAWWMKDTALGLAVLGVLVHATLSERDQQGRRPLYIALLSARPLVLLGERSYSLYLIHAPILALVGALFIGLPATIAYPLVFLVGFPTCIAVAWLFFELIERRFLYGPRKAPRPAPANTLPEGKPAEAA